MLFFLQLNKEVKYIDMPLTACLQHASDRNESRKLDGRDVTNKVYTLLV